MICPIVAAVRKGGQLAHLAGCEGAGATLNNTGAGNQGSTSGDNIARIITPDIAKLRHRQANFN